MLIIYVHFYPVAAILYIRSSQITDTHSKTFAAYTNIINSLLHSYTRLIILNTRLIELSLSILIQTFIFSSSIFRFHFFFTFSRNFSLFFFFTLLTVFPSLIFFVIVLPCFFLLFLPCFSIINVKWSEGNIKKRKNDKMLRSFKYGWIRRVHAMSIKRFAV